MANKNLSQKFKFKNVDGTGQFFMNELISKKHKTVCTTYIEYFLILGSGSTGCVYVFVLASLVGILVGITSTTIESNTCAITAEINYFKLIIKKKEIKE